MQGSKGRRVDFVEVSQVRPDLVCVILNLASWPLNASKFPMPGRIEPIHKVTKLSESGLSTAEGWDDELTFNTQVNGSWSAASSRLTSLTEILTVGQSRPLAR
jgi:hypothetical protein